MSHFTTGQVVTAADLNALHSLIASATADGTSATLQVTSIPQTHRDLLVFAHGSNNGSELRNVDVRFNGDSGSNYRYVHTRTLDNGTITPVASQSHTGMVIGRFGDDGNINSLRLEVPNYSAAKNHSATWQSGGKQGVLGGNSQHAAGWGAHISANPITSIQAVMAVDGWGAGSTLRVYGLGLL